MDFNVSQLRQKLAAPSRPDEGMRGTAADKVRQDVVQQLEIFEHIAKLLTNGTDQEVEDSAAAIRSCLMGPAEGNAICDIVALPLCSALQRTGAFESCCWLLWAMVRLAQFQDCHKKLLDAGIVEALMTSWKGDSEGKLGQYRGSPCNARLDIVTCHILAFLSETGGIMVALQVPLSAIDIFVLALETRLSIAKEFSELQQSTECTEAETLVKRRGFYGCPLYYRPRFILQALTGLALASEEHARAMWSTNLPDILAQIIEGSLPNDSIDNKPYGSPDAIDMCGPLSKALMFYSDCVGADARNGLAQALDAASSCKAVAL